MTGTDAGSGPATGTSLTEQGASRHLPFFDYRAFADHFGIAHIALNLSAGQRTWGIYHIQNVNNYGSRLKGWMRRFNGVATKYLGQLSRLASHR